ncbi:hypothetical protein [Tenacibaculum geojense]|uniref:Lipoprotein n=1 Tax=Tenacibaculum geojense TaxID=915352 RepID=A0ABW3JSJ3_9FLAO
MKKTIILILLIVLVSCKNKTAQKEPLVTVKKIDTVYCNNNQKNTQQNLTMYNEQYTSEFVYNYINQLISYSNTKDTVFVCDALEATVNLTKNNDTIFTHCFNKTVIANEYDNYYKKLKSLTGEKAEEITNYIQQLKPNLNDLRFDSIRYKSVRTNTIYYDAFFSNTADNNVYKINLGIDYLGDVGTYHITNVSPLFKQ